jgi:FKBP-type peptidyl-prolyl cis-trans isomerase SlyD
MKISDNKVVQIHYVLKDEDGKELESSYGQEPLAYLHGKNNMLVGVEKALTDKAAGDKFSITLAPEDAYGERKEDAVERISVKHLHGATKWAPGMVATINTEQGQMQVTIIKVGKFMATCDINPPLAGKTLTFDLEVVDVRDATDAELEHGHAHGAGGHHH